MSIWGLAEWHDPPQNVEKWAAEIVQRARTSIRRHAEYDQGLLTNAGESDYRNKQKLRPGNAPETTRGRGAPRSYTPRI